MPLIRLTYCVVNNTGLSIIYLACPALQIVANITAEVNEDIAEPIAIIVVTVGGVKASRILCGVLYFRSV